LDRRKEMANQTVGILGLGIFGQSIIEALISQDVVILSGQNKEEIIATLLDVDIRDTAEKQIIKRQIIEREKITSTEIGNKVAIPHTIVNKLNETKIIIGIHEEGIIWSKEKVKVIILILFSDKTVAQEQLIRKILIKQLLILLVWEVFHNSQIKLLLV